MGLLATLLGGAQADATPTIEAPSTVLPMPRPDPRGRVQMTPEPTPNEQIYNRSGDFVEYTDVHDGGYISVAKEHVADDNLVERTKGVITPDRFAKMVESFPESGNIEDRRDEGLSMRDKSESPGGRGMAAGPELLETFAKFALKELIKPRSNTLLSGDVFDPEGGGYDMERARAAGMRPDPANGHWGSVAPVSKEEQAKYGLPPDSYVMLKGRGHKTWDLGEQGETKRGYQVVKYGNRYYSVPVQNIGW